MLMAPAQAGRGVGMQSERLGAILLALSIALALLTVSVAGLAAGRAATESCRGVGDPSLDRAIADIFQ